MKFDQLSTVLKEKRLSKGMKQLDVVEGLKLIGLSNAKWSSSSYSLIEKGERAVSVQELVELSRVLDFSISEFISGVFEVPLEPVTPTVNFELFKNMLLYILDRCKDKAHFGKTVLYKVLYFSDFNYYERHKEYLSGLTYSRLPMGPVPNITGLFDELKKSGDIEKTHEQFHNRTLHKFVAHTEPDLSVLSEDAKKVIDHAIATYSDMLAFEISEYSHGDAPWLETDDFQVIDYNLVFKRNKKYSYEKN
ncbi:MAG: DUF4065 domain-containing protein [Bacteroidia bacterium]